MLGRGSKEIEDANDEEIAIKEDNTLFDYLNVAEFLFIIWSTLIVWKFQQAIIKNI